MSKDKQTKNKAIKCYASALGNCSDIQSNEHYISQSLFNGNMIDISGVPWVKNGEVKTVSKSKLGLKILCSYHNNLLSPLDLKAKEIASKFDSFFDKCSERTKLPRSAIWKKDTYPLNGFAFEQWMIKASIGGMFIDPDLTWHPDNSAQLKPPLNILEALIGLTKLEFPMGLYLTMLQGEKIKKEERAGVNSITHGKTKGYIGSLVNFRNIQFLLWLSEEPIGSTFKSWTGIRFGPNQNEPAYRIDNFAFPALWKLSGIINFDWSEEPIKLI